LALYPGERSCHNSPAHRGFATDPRATVRKD
jgi:hypothetical protein